MLLGMVYLIAGVAPRSLQLLRGWGDRSEKEEEVEVEVDGMEPKRRP